MPLQSEGAVLVGLELSRAGLAALDLAADIAIGRGSHLIVLHSAQDPRQGREVLASAVARLRASRAPIVVHTESASEEPASALLRRGSQCALVVVGHHGRAARTGRVPTGSVALRVATRAAVPVVVHRPPVGHTPTGQPVTVGIGTAPDEEPLAFAFAEADRIGVPLVVEHVWSGPADVTAASAGVYHEAAARALAEATRLVDDTVAVWSGKFPDVEVRRALRHGLDPTFALTAASRTARLLVVGSTVSAAPLVQALIHRARCPVAFVPCGHRN